MDNRSTFVTVVAWVFIVLSGFASIIVALQLAMLSKFPRAIDPAGMPEEMPMLFQWMYEYTFLLFYGFAGAIFATFISAIGLLKRRNWARIIFIAVLCLGILWQLIGLLFQHFVFSEMDAFVQGQGDDEFVMMQNMIMVVTYIFAGGLAILFAWIIKKLVTHPIVDEFRSTSR